MLETQGISWDDRYCIGIEMIDTQHQQLFNLVNRLYDLEEHQSTKEDLRIILYEFSDYMKIHFQEEEEYMASINFPELDEHKEIHQELIEQLSAVITKPAKLSILKTKMRILAKRILIDHIMNEDTKIRLFVSSQTSDDIFIDITDL